jgi:outer membrane immunogenic protein
MFQFCSFAPAVGRRSDIPGSSIEFRGKFQQIISFRDIHFALKCCISETVFPVESGIFSARIRPPLRSPVNLQRFRIKRSEEKCGENSMKKLLLGTVALIALGAGAPASAADLAPYSKAAPPMMPAYYDWSGFYLGLNGGGGSSRKCWDLIATPALGVIVPPAPEGCHDATGGTAGGQVGYRWQSGPVVFGLELQGNWANFRGSNINLVFPTIRDQSRIDAFGLFTGQIGYSWNTVLLYAKGGAAVTGDHYATFAAVPGGALIDKVSEARWGGTIGGGVEFSFAPNWSVAAEYDHLFMGTRNVSAFTPAGVFSATDRVRQDVDLATVRVNYRWGGPVIAKY